jgi:glycine dehydrogenase subunit 2
MVYHQAVWDEPLLVELDSKGKLGITFPSYKQIDDSSADNLVPKKIIRKAVKLPSLSQPEVVRHFTKLSQMNFGIDLGPYFLGSCTMKHNPKVSERIALNPDFSELHPYQEEDSMQGILQIFYELSEMLAEITGTSRVSLAPAAGAHGEFVGALIIRKRLQELGQLKERNEMLIPDSAHGTNPATASMANFRVVRIPSDDEGLVDIEALKKAASKRTAGIMLTVPNTHGLFEKNIREICSIVKEDGGFTYYDGANLNAILGKARPGDMGFDIVHLNLHKTFATPHGGGGPGAGPVGVKEHLADYLPIPLIKKGKKYSFDYDRPKSIGRIKNFYGNSSLLLRAYVYIRMFGKEGLPMIAEQAVLAANYLLAKIKGDDYAPSHKTRAPVKHEFVVSVKNITASTGVRAMDIAKAILDEGMHAPTTYFPLTVEEDLMIEPTDSEPLSSLDRYAEALKKIAELARRDASQVLLSPKNTAVGRLDEVKANHPMTLTLNWNKIVE